MTFLVAIHVCDASFLPFSKTKLSDVTNIV
jgi:hypothetical protein